MFAAWRRGGGFDTVFVPVFMALGAFPAYFTALLGVYFIGLKLGWFPIQHAYGNEVDARAELGVHLRARSSTAFLPALVIVLAFAGGWVLNMRTVMINTIARGLRRRWRRRKACSDRRVMTRYAARNAILPPLNGFAPQFATAVGGVIFVELVFSYPGAGFTLQQAALGKDLPADAGAAADLRGLPDRRELHHRPRQPRPRPAGARDMSAGPGRAPDLAARRRGARGSPRSRSGCRCSLQNPKARVGLFIFGTIVLLGVIAPLIADPATRDELQLLDARRPPSLAPPLRHERPGLRRLGDGRSRRAPLAGDRLLRSGARDGARDGARHHRRIRRRPRRRDPHAHRQRRLRHPDDPAADRRDRVPAPARHDDDGR